MIQVYRVPRSRRGASIDHALLTLSIEVGHHIGPIYDAEGNEVGVITACEIRDPRSKGLGDTIEKATRAVGIKPCGGCKKRRDKLNRLLPYRDSP